MIIKICGIQEIETLLCCENNNVNFFGMIFYNDSPRNISIEKARKLQNFSKKLNIEGVGVFVNTEFNKIIKFIEELNLKIVQLHGDENNQYIKEIKNLGVKVIKKIAIRDSSDLKEIDNYQDADFYLFDYKPKLFELPGGNAKSFDWNILENLNTIKPWFLSGGINLENIHYIKKKLKPFGIDLSSALEKELGIKDNRIINNFIERFKNAKK